MTNITNKLELLTNYKQFLQKECTEQANQMFKQESRKLNKLSLQKQSNIENIIQHEKDNLIELLDKELLQKTYKARSLSVRKKNMSQDKENNYDDNFQSVQRQTADTMDRSFQTIKKQQNIICTNNYSTNKPQISQFYEQIKVKQLSQKSQRKIKFQDRLLKYRQIKSKIKNNCSNCIKNQKLIQQLDFNQKLLQQQELTIELISEQLIKTSKYTNSIQNKIQTYKHQVHTLLDQHLKNIDQALSNQNAITNLYKNNSRLKLERDHVLNLINQI